MYALWFLFISPLGSNTAHSVDNVNDRPSWLPENSRHLTRNVHLTGRKPMPSDTSTRPVLTRQPYTGPAAFTCACQKALAVLRARFNSRFRVFAPIIRTFLQP